MKKQLLCVVLALAMLTALLAGCASNETAPAEESAVPAESAAPAEESAAPAEEDPVEEPAAPAITYPLTGDDLTLTYWYYVPPYTQVVDSNENFFCIPYAEEATGVHLEFQEVGNEVSSEQFNLMVASGEWTDIIPASEYYTGGLAKAYEDDVIMDLTDYVSEFMPDFMTVYNEQDTTTQKAALTEGMMLSFVNIADGSYSGNGIVTRGDWLDKLGFEFSGETIDLDEFTEFLRAIHDEFGPDYTYMLEPSAQIGQLNAAFDCYIPNLYEGFMSVIGPQIYRNGDEVLSGWTADGYRDYIEWCLQMFSEGVLYESFLEVDTDRLVQNNMIGTGKVGSWQANADKLDECAAYKDEANADWRAQAVPPVVADPSQQSIWVQTPNLVSAGTSITTTSEKAELACKWMNYFWTEQGRLLTNYGVEGETYAMDENGDFTWLDMIINNPIIGNAEMGVAVFTYARFSTSYLDNDRLLSTFTENALNAVETWTIEGTDERYFPAILNLTTDESEEISTYEGDVLTYGQETALKFLTGELELNDANWNEYVQKLNDMGLDEIVAVYQSAYDQFIAGER